MISQALDWLDESAAGIIRIAYLLAGVVAVGAYFSDGHVPGGIADVLNAIQPWMLASAIEIHTYLTARRVRAAWQALQASNKGADEHMQASRSMKVNLGILGGLLTFSMYNQLEYLAATWTPPHTALTLPGPLAYVLRAVVTPAAFMAAAFLAPMGASLAAQVNAEAHRFAAATFKVARKQWRARLTAMQRSGADVTGALVQLIEDPGERHVIEVIYGAMYPQQQESVPALPEPRSPTPTLPTGPGTPAVHVNPRSNGHPEAGGSNPLDSDRETVANGHVVALPQRVTRRVVASRRKASAKGVRTVDTWEPQARKAWAAGARTVTPMVEATGMPRSQASKWVRVLKAENGVQQNEGQVAL